MGTGAGRKGEFGQGKSGRLTGRVAYSSVTSNFGRS